LYEILTGKYVSYLQAFKLVRMQLTLDRRLPQSAVVEYENLESHDPDNSDVERQTWEVVVKMDARNSPEPLSARRIGGVSDGTVSLSWSMATGNGTYVPPEAVLLHPPGLMDLVID
jgi:hypothetical protein